MFPSAFLCRALGAALLLTAGAAATGAEPARLPPPIPAAASAPRGAPGAAPHAAATPSPEIGIPDLRQRINERLAALRAARLVARRSERAASAAAQDTAPPTEAASGSRLQALALQDPIPADAAGRAAPPRAGRRAVASADSHAEPAWSYSGVTGPAAWAALKPEYAACGSGRRQSPIDVRDGIAVDLEPLAFDYRPGAFSVLDNGHTVQVDVAPGNTLAVGGRRYELKQFHFHRPSEERLEGRGYEMSVHLVHADAEGRLAVVAVLVEGGKAHPLVQQVWNNLPLERHEPQAAPEPIDPAALLPQDRRYATYMGSLTTPPCSEGVRWIVLKQPATLSPEQIAIFARLYPMNARPLQAVSGRLVKASR